MAALPPIQRISREDMKEAPDWITRLLNPLNQFLDSVYAALNKGLTFKENFLSQIYAFQIIAGAAAANNTAKFTLTMKVKPTFIFMTASPSSGDTFNPAFTWSYDGANVNITSISSLTSGTTYNLTVLMV